MDLSKVPGWILALSVFLIAVGFVVSLFFLKEPRFFAGLNFGPPISSVELPVQMTIEGQELPSNGGNRKTSVCSSGSYMVGMRFQIDSGNSHGVVSNLYPVCGTAVISASK